MRYCMQCSKQAGSLGTFEGSANVVVVVHAQGVTAATHSNGIIAMQP